MKHFTERELRCHCCGQLPLPVMGNIEALVNNVLDPVREQYGKPIYVNSCYRCPKHNAEVGGVPHSQHCVGEAADIRPSTGLAIDLIELQRIIEAIGNFDQMIIYPTFIHVSWKRKGTNRKRIIKKRSNIL